MTQQPQQDSEATRRTLLAGVGIAGLAGTLAACNLTGGGASAQGGSTPTSSAPAPSKAPTDSSMPAKASKPVVLGRAHEVPVGGGKVFTAHKVVVTQPKKGKFLAFSAVCTHMQCLVDRVAAGTIDCPCHGSKFSVKNAAVVAGPAPSPLAKATIKVKRGRILLMT